jgi:hypothetical protein
MMLPMSTKYDYTFRGKDKNGDDYILSFSSPVEIEWETELYWEEFDE